MRRGSALAVLGSSVLAASRSAGAQTLPKIDVIALPIDACKAVHYGATAGIFQKAGVDVAVQTLPSGAAATAALVGGSTDVAFTNITTLVNAYLKGVPIQIIAPGILNTPDRQTVGIVVRADSPIRSPRDLSGKTIASVDLGASAAAGLKALVDHDGADPTTLRFIEAPTSTLAQMVVDGRVAAAVINEPALSQSVATGATRIIGDPMAALSKRFLLAAYAVIAPVAAQKADAMRRFATGMHVSQVYCNTHLPETVQLVASFTGTSPDVVAHSVRVIDGEYVEPDLLQPIIDGLAKYGVTSKAFPAREIISPFALRH